MSSINAECFVALTPFASDCVIFGTNSYRLESEATEVLYFPSNQNKHEQKVRHAIYKMTFYILTLELKCTTIYLGYGGGRSIERWLRTP